MAVPNKPAALTSSRAIAPAPEPSSRTNSGLVLDERHRAHKFTLYLMRDRLECHLGEFVGTVLVATTEPGINGNGNDASGTGARMACQGLGAVQVPDDFPIEAFGQSGEGHPISYLRRWEQRTQADGQERLVAVHYSDAWHRPVIRGGQTKWEVDLVGYNKFLRDVTLWAHGGELDEALVSEAVDRTVNQIRTQSVQAGASSNLQLRVMLGHLPDSHTPLDVAKLRARFEAPKADDGEPASRRKGKSDPQPTA